MSKSTDISAPDLTQRPPRSPKSRLGGYALLPRMLDKGRATIAGKNGEYHYDCPLDQHGKKKTTVPSARHTLEVATLDSQNDSRRTKEPCLSLMSASLVG